VGDDQVAIRQNRSQLLFKPALKLSRSADRT
jgi:hypothetical protein